MVCQAECEANDAWQLIDYLRSGAERARHKPVFVAHPADELITSEAETIRIEVLATGLETPWGLVFLPDDRILLIERSGRLRIIDHEHLSPEPVTSTPAV